MAFLNCVPDSVYERINVLDKKIDDLNVAMIDAIPGMWELRGTNRLVTKGYLSKDIIHVAAKPDQVKIAVEAYDSSDTYVGTWDGDSFESSVTWFNEISMPTLGDYKFKIVAARTDDTADITTDYAKYIYFSVASSKATDTTLTMSGVPADAKAVGDNIGNVETSIENVATKLPVKITGWTSGYYISVANGAANVDNPTRSSAYRYKTIPCVEGDAFMISGTSTSAQLWMFIDSGYACLCRSGSGITRTSEVVIAPAGSMYLIINDTSGDDSYEINSFYTNVKSVIKREEDAAATAMYERIGLEFEKITNWVAGYDITDDGIKANCDTPKTNSTYKYSIIPCSAKTLFMVSGQCGTGANVWMFVDNEYNILESSGRGTSVENIKLIAPEGASYLIINDKSNSDSYYTKPLAATLITNWVEGYDITIQEDEAILDKPKKNSTYKYSIIPCSRGDAFIISGKCGAGTHVCMFVDNEYNILESSGRGTSVENIKFIAPEGAFYLIINDNSKSNSYILSSSKGMAYLSKRINRKFSIVGASMCTFAGYLPSDEAGYDGVEAYTTYYSPSQTARDIVDVQSTWFMKLAAMSGMTLLRNASWSGSTVTTQKGNTVSTATNTARAACSTRRITDLAKDGVSPDVIIVWMGSNDFKTEDLDPAVLIGSWGIDPSTGQFTGCSPIPEEGAVTTFSEAYALMLSKMMRAYPKAEIYCCTQYDTDNEDRDYEPSSTTRTFPTVNRMGYPLKLFNDAIKNIADCMGAKVIDLHDCGISYWNVGNYTLSDHIHPTAVGATVIANKMYKDIMSQTKYLR